MNRRCRSGLAFDCGFPAGSQLDLALIGHKQIANEAGLFFFVGAEQSFDRPFVLVAPSTFELLEVCKFDRSRRFERVFVICEPNHEREEAGSCTTEVIQCALPRTMDFSKSWVMACAPIRQRAEILR
jgi:hypothetical protein